MKDYNYRCTEEAGRVYFEELIRHLESKGLNAKVLLEDERDTFNLYVRVYITHLMFNRKIQRPLIGKVLNRSVESIRWYNKKHSELLSTAGYKFFLAQLEAEEEVRVFNYAELRGIEEDLVKLCPALEWEIVKLFKKLKKGGYNYGESSI